MDKKNVAVVMGGYSDEYVVSLKSGQLIYESLDRELYNVYRVVILKEKWYFVDDHNVKVEINKSDFSVDLDSGYKVKFDVCFNITDRSSEHFYGFNLYNTILQNKSKDTCD